jgi:hypothetical protein
MPRPPQLLLCAALTLLLITPAFAEGQDTTTPTSEMPIVSETASETTEAPETKPALPVEISATVESSTEPDTTVLDILGLTPSFLSESSTSYRVGFCLHFSANEN